MVLTLNSTCPISLLPKRRVGARILKHTFEVNEISASKDSLIIIIGFIAVDDVVFDLSFLRIISVRYVYLLSISIITQISVNLIDDGKRTEQILTRS